ncbi:MAG: sigma-54-dependent transcriptional regulator [Candidatus Binatia bacterium]
MIQHRQVLVVDDEEKIRRVLDATLSAMGLSVSLAANGDEAIAALDQDVDLVITDLKMPGSGGMDVLAATRELGHEVPVIIMTAYGTVGSAVQAMKQGAYDYVTKPFNLDEIEILVKRALEVSALTTEYNYLRESGLQRLEDLIGSSEAMSRLFEQLRRVASSEVNVLIRGETGTGKELVARAVHSLSSRRDRLFVPVNCAAIPLELLESELFGHVKGAFTGANDDRVGKFELASGGTLFLDEIGDMPLQLQAKILRVLEEGVVEKVGGNNRIQVNTRVLSATNRDLAVAIEKGEFRQDLYYRLDVLNLSLPPLRERGSDIALLADHFMKDAAVKNGRGLARLDADALELFNNYDWPGNVRELRNVCQRLVVLTTGETISADMVDQLLDLRPPDTALGTSAGDGSGSLADAVAAVESDTIRRSLESCGNNKVRAAKALGISERSLWYKIKKYGLGSTQPRD